MKLKIAEHKIALFLLTTGVTFNYVFDGINKIGNLYFPIFSRSAIMYRFLLELVCIIIILSFINKKRVNWLIGFTYFILCFFIGNLYLKYIIGIDIFLGEQFIYFNKYFFIFFIFFATYKVLRHATSLERVIKNFKKVFLFNGCIALVGMFFGIKLFSTFPIGAARFGYDGLILLKMKPLYFIY